MHKRWYIWIPPIMLMAGFAQTWALARPVTTLDMLELRDVGGISISPNGRYIVFQERQANATRNDYANWWVLLDTRSRVLRTIIANDGDPLFDSSGEWQTYAPVWSPDSRTFFYVRGDRGHASVYRATLEGQNQRVTVPPGDISDFRPDGLSNVYVAIDAPSPETRSDAADQQENGMLFNLGYGAWGQKKINQFAPWLGPPNFHAATVTSGYDMNSSSEAVRPQPQAPGALYVPTSVTRGIKNFYYALFASTSPDGKRETFLASIQARGSGQELTALYIAPAQGGEAIRVTPLSSASIRQVNWAPDGKYVYYLEGTNYTDQNLFAVDANTRTSRQVTKVNAYLDNCSFASGASLAVCTIESTQRPQEIALVHLDTGRVETLTDLNRAYNSLEKTRFEKFVWTNKHHDTTFGVLTYPSNYHPGERYPLIITSYRAHGFLRGAVGDEYPVDVFAANGFFVLSFDILNVSYTPLALGQQQPFSLTILDWQSPLDSLEQIIGVLNSRGLIDARHVGISGLSHGTEITDYAISHSRDFAAAISDGGSARDPLFYYLKSESWNTLFKAWGLEGPPYDANYPKWKMMSPALNASRVTAPLLMNAPDQEYVIALQWYWELSDRKKPVEMWIFPDEGHIKHQPLHRLVVYNRNQSRPRKTGLTDKWSPCCLRGEETLRLEQELVTTTSA